ncbi:MAG TPA: DUF501 domain-containing protein [Actinomycetota bacterium]|nr:DUF501 domain-containing protein [Actinomycetota bacterium]
MVASEDRDVVAVQIGREPRGEIATTVRCEHGLPMVVRTPSTLETGEPFPTLYWLTCPLAARAIGKLESSGEMRVLNERLQADTQLASAYRDAHERYRIDRDGDPEGRDESAGGMPGRVKCLHALYAHELADANPVGAIVRDTIEPLGCPAPCVERSEQGDARPVLGHPGFARARR